MDSELMVNKKVEKQTLGMQSECVHVPTASTITVKIKKKKSVVMGDWPREHCKFNRCIIDQDHIFSLRKKPYRSPENKLKAKYHICWKINRNEVTLRWLMSWKPATHFDYQKKLQSWWSKYGWIYTCILLVSALKKTIDGHGTWLLVCGFY